MTERQLFLRLQEHRRRVLFSVFVHKKGLEPLNMVNSVVEYAVRLLKEFDRKKLEFTGGRECGSISSSSIRGTCSCGRVRW